MPIKRIVVDILIPNDIDILDFTERIAAIDHVDGVTLHVLEIDERTKTVEVTIEGKHLYFKDINSVIEILGGSVHSIDMVSAGARMIDSMVTKREEE